MSFQRWVAGSGAGSFPAALLSSLEDVWNELERRGCPPSAIDRMMRDVAESMSAAINDARGEAWDDDDF